MAACWPSACSKSFKGAFVLASAYWIELNGDTDLQKGKLMPTQLVAATAVKQTQQCAPPTWDALMLPLTATCGKLSMAAQPALKGWAPSCQPGT